MWYTFLGLVQAEFSHQTYSCAAGLGSKKMVTQLLPELLPNIQVSTSNRFIKRQLVDISHME